MPYIDQNYYDGNPAATIEALRQLAADPADQIGVAAPAAPTPVVAELPAPEPVQIPPVPSGKPPVPQGPAGDPAQPQGPAQKGDAYAAMMQQYRDLQQQIAQEYTRQGQALDQYQKDAAALRAKAEPNWGEKLADAIQPIARGFLTAKTKWTPGMIRNGTAPPDVVGDFDRSQALDRQARQAREAQAERQIGQLRDYMEMRNRLGETQARAGELGVRAAEVGIRGQERSEDVAFRDKQLAAENARHAQSIAVQREHIGATLKAAEINRQAQNLNKVREVAGQFGEGTAKDVLDQLNKLENDELYKKSNTMKTSAANVGALLDQGGSFSQIISLLQAARAAGDTGVISDSDMNRYVGGSVSLLQQWQQRLGTEATGKLPPEAVKEIKESMKVLENRADGAIGERRQLFRDHFDRSQQLRFEANQKIYGKLPGVDLMGKDDLDRTFGLVKPAPAPAQFQGGNSPGTPGQGGAGQPDQGAAQPAQSPNYGAKIQGMTAAELKAEVNTWGNLSNEQRQALQGELKRRGIMK